MPKRKLASIEDDNNIKNEKEIETLNVPNIVADVAPLAPMTRLGRTFFDVPCIQLAKRMLGKLLVRKILQSDGSLLEMTARIVETEAYLGGEDKASHSYKGRKTPRNKAMFMAPGTAYVYSIHAYVCFNISAQNEGGAVLIRACEPMIGSTIMTGYRTKNKPLKFKELCNGPSKLCIALMITKELFNQVDLTTCDNFFVADDNFGDVSDVDITCCPRIGISNYAEEWTEKPLRFYITKSDFVSVKYKNK